jgi:rhodanese-related sulfurtransferase
MTEGASSAWGQLVARFPHAARAGALVALALVVGASYNAANRLGLRWTPSPDGRIGVPRIYEHRLPEISAAEALQMLKARSAVFVDARDEKEYRADHIPGAINIPMRAWQAVWPKTQSQLPREASIVLYCYGGVCGLSTRMAKRLLELGYERPIVLRRGWAEWTEGHYPTVRRPAGKAR